MASQIHHWKKLHGFLAAILVASSMLAFFWISEGNWKSPLKRSIVPKSKRPHTGNYAVSTTSSDRNGNFNHDSAIRIPDWIQGYKIWHKRQRRRYDKEGATDVKFLVVACLKRTQCGGLSDRIRSIPYWLVLAEKTDRVLLIHWSKKFKLEDFWIPPRSDELDWTLFERWKTRPPFINSCILKPAKVLPEFHDESNHQGIMNSLQSSEGVVCVKTRADLTSIVYDSFGTTDINQIVVSNVFQSLFNPTETLQEYINTIKKEQIGLNANEQYLAAHIRALYPLKSESGLVFPTWQEHSEMIKRWAHKAVESVIGAYKKTQNSQANASLPPVYVASDSADVVDYLLSSNASWPTRLLGLKKSLPRHHLELDTANNSAYDMFPLFFDISMLSHAKCLSFGIGSYGKLGARLSGLECITQHRKSLHFKDYSPDANIEAKGHTVELLEDDG
mmetsp:Transcript_42698/g.103258  ORF Transcript_42698/g.103258 Transcript_42698/m.103258 type:complete len:446 (+) Transcript_42698:206-1543(+)